MSTTEKKKSVEAVIKNQVIGYNTRDINLFASCHAKDVELFTFGETEPFCVGIDQLIEKYSHIFENSPNLHTEIVNRIIMGNTVIDHEIVTGRKGVEQLELVAIYELKDAKINRAYFKFNK